jgi:hypothetical protein
MSETNQTNFSGWARENRFRDLVNNPALEGVDIDAIKWAIKEIETFRKDVGRRSPEYNVWVAMRQRCSNPLNKRYQRYGGRGISVCSSWSVFANFLADMGHRPGPRYSIERKDNDGDYDPGNCVWATDRIQSRNKSTSILIEFNGKTQCLADWATELGINFYVLRGRLNAGWPIDRAFTESLQNPATRMATARSFQLHKVTAFSQTMTVSDWSRKTKLSRNCIASRLKCGMEPELALSLPSVRGGISVNR